MGRRSRFKRVAKDQYFTFDRKAYPPLQRHLPSCVRFLEPCGGAYDMAESLEELGHECVAAFDIAPRDGRVHRCDAMTITAEEVAATGADMFITNTPWTRPIMHPMLWHLSGMLPTWALFDAAWIHTTQELQAKRHGFKSQPELMEHCHMIVSVGRLLWIEGTKQRSVDDCAWYLFDRKRPRLTRYPVFVGPQINEKPAA